tara:strand:- start:2068 stop:3189 length:1122 start_codon:yes stop_codon:yes gene_type:complete
MKIAIDVRTLSKPKSGIGYYVQSLINGLNKFESPYEYFLFSDNQGILNEIKKNQKITYIKSPFSHENHLVGDLWENTALPHRLRAEGISLFHGPSYIIPFIKKGFKTIATIHDIAFFLYPDMEPLKFRIYMRCMIKAITKRADLIIAVSASTKSDLVNILNVPEEKIRVVHSAVNEKYYKLEHKNSSIKKKYNINKNYFLFVGDLLPRKNISKLFEAFSLLPERIKNEYQIVIVGGRKYSFKRIENTLKENNLTSSVIFTGYINEEDILLLYNSADIFVFPSFYEGFGFPILEAMSCGVPVITSNVSSMPEIAGDAAILIDPNDSEELAGAISTLVDDADLRQKKIEAGFKRANLFSLKKMTEKTVNIYKELV